MLLGQQYFEGRLGPTEDSGARLQESCCRDRVKRWTVSVSMRSPKSEVRPSLQLG